MITLIQNGCRLFFYNHNELLIKELYQGTATYIDIQDVDTGEEFQLPIYVIKSFTTFKGEEHEVAN